MMRSLLLFAAAVALVGCAARKPPPVPDAGDDGGTDAGAPDAGRQRGADPDAGYSTMLELPDSGAPTLRVGVSAALALDQFGQPIGDFQAIRWMLADMRTRLDAAELLALRAAQAKESKVPFTREASMAKLFASETSNWVCDRAVQIHGGYGYLDEFPVERYLRDARVQTIYEGTSEIQRLVIAREVIKAAGA